MQRILSLNTHKTLHTLISKNELIQKIKRKKLEKYTSIKIAQRV